MKNFKKLDNNHLVNKVGGGCVASGIVTTALVYGIFGGVAGFVGGIIIGAAAYAACNL